MELSASVMKRGLVLLCATTLTPLGLLADSAAAQGKGELPSPGPALSQSSKKESDLFGDDEEPRAKPKAADEAPTRPKPAEGELEMPFNAAIAYGMVNVSNSNSMSDVFTGLAGKGPYGSFAWTLSDRHVLEGQLGIFENAQQLAATQATLLVGQYKFFWSPLFYQSFGVTYSDMNSKIKVSTQPNASYGTKRLLVHSGFGNRLQLARFTIDLEYVALAYMASLLSESYGIDDAAVRQLYKSDEKQANGTFVFYRALHLAVGFDF